jgi:tRNA(adenine34) deaminase
VSYNLRLNTERIQDELYMRMAIREAECAFIEDEVPVGTVVICGGKILASDHNRVRALGSATAHGEMLALAAAAKAIGDWRLHDCTMYTTKEPCPMCAGACIMSRVNRVVYGVSDSLMGCFGGSPCNLAAISGFNHKPRIEAGVLHAECLALLRRFFFEKREIQRQQKVKAK